MSEFQTFKYLFLGEGFTCSEAAWTYGKGCSVAASHRPKVLRDLSCFDAALKPQMLGMRLKVLGTDASSSCKTQHDTTRKIFLPWGIFAVSSTSKRWFVKVSAIQGTFWSIVHGKETSLKWTRRSCCRDSSQELSKILLIFTQIVQLALLLYSLHSCSRPQESGIWIATQL